MNRDTLNAEFDQLVGEFCDLLASIEIEADAYSATVDSYAGLDPFQLED